jgi:succinyl-CoA synthetase alpha subunit
MIKIELTVDEVNVILRSLAKHPFEEVVALIGKIKAQGEPQVAELVKQAEAAQKAAAESAANPAAPAQPGQPVA